jgi:trigger factor
VFQNPFLPDMPSISISRESDTRVKADLTVNAEEIKPAEEQALKKIGSKAEIKGFRKGKAPLHLIRQKFASDIRLETIFALVDNHISDVEKKIEERVFRLVRIEDVQDKGEKLSFAVKLDLYPYVKIGKLKIAQLTRNVPAIDDADVEREIKDRLLKFATYEASESPDLSAEKSDKLTVDFEIWVDDAPSGEVNKDYEFELGSGTLSRELEQQIIVAKGKVGQEYKLKKDIPAQEGGANRSYEIIATIKKIAKPNLPELTDAFVTENFKGNTNIADFKTKLKEDLERRFNVAQTRAETDQALKTLEAGAQFFISESFIDQKLEEFAAERKIEISELSEGQIANLRKGLSEREQPGLLMRQLISDAEKFHQKKNKSEESYIEAFKRYIHEEILRFEGQNEKSGGLLAELDNAVDAMVAGNTNRSPWESLVSSYLTVFSREFLFRYFDDEGIVKKGKKMTYRELADHLASLGAEATDLQ